MIGLRILTALGLGLFVSACIESETDLRINKDETVEADIKVNLSRALFDMAASIDPNSENLCPADARREIGTKTIICEFTQDTTLDEAIGAVAKAKTQDPFLKDIKLDRIDKERIRVTLPLDFDNIAYRPSQLSEDNPRYNGILDELKGKNLVFRLHAAEIENTNGELTNNGKTVEFVIPAAELLQPSGNLPKEYTAVLKYRSCGLIGFACRDAE